MDSWIGWIGRWVPRGSAVLAITTSASYILGLVRDKIFAHTFGAGVSMDSYNAAFLVPDFAFNVLVASGIAAAGVPLFMELQRRNRRDAYDYMSALLFRATVTMFVVGVIIFAFAPFWGRIVAPGLPAEGHILLVRLLRIMAWSPILFAASNALGALLVAGRRFWGYGLSPVVYNVGIIAGTLWLAPTMGIVGAAWGTVLGALFHVAARLIEVWWCRWSLTLSWGMPAALWRRTLRLMAPKMIGHPVEMVTFGVFTNLASHLAAGSITILSFARNFQSVPVSVLGIAMATAVFPALSEAALSTGEELRHLFRRTALLILAVSSAAALGLFILRRPLIELLLGGGAFGPAEVAQTALVLGVFCLAVPTESLSHLFARAFYATQHTVTPVVFSVASLLIASASAYLLLPRLGIVALPLGFWLGSLVKTAGLYWLFLRRINLRLGSD